MSNTIKNKYRFFGTAKQIDEQFEKSLNYFDPESDGGLFQKLLELQKQNGSNENEHNEIS